MGTNTSINLLKYADRIIGHNIARRGTNFGRVVLHFRKTEYHKAHIV